MIQIIFAIGPMFAVDDRFTGGDYITKIRDWLIARGPPAWVITVLKVRTFVWAMLALAPCLALLGYFTAYGPKLAVLTLSVAAWRADGWEAFGGDIDPRTLRQDFGLFARHLLSVPAFVPAVAWLDQAHWGRAAVAALICMIAFSLYATLLGMIYARNERADFDFNRIVEPARGLGLGIAAATALVLGA